MDLQVVLATYYDLLLGCLTLAMTNPIWVVKTRLCLKDSTALPDHMRYHHFRDGIYKLVKFEGLSGMYKVGHNIESICGVLYHFEGLPL